MPEMDEQSRNITPAQWYVVALIVAFSVGSVLYKYLVHQQLGHSAAMFLGIPAVLAILLALAPKARTVTGGILKGITLALLVMAPLLGEGFLCILVASPLFYLVGIIVGLLVDRQRSNKHVTLSCTVLLLVPMCLEGITPKLTLSRIQSAEAKTVIDSPYDLVESHLARKLDVSTLPPLALRIGFSRPLWALGEGLSVGDTRLIHFAGAEGDPPGDLILHITERRPGYVRFVAVSDTSKVSQWVHWTSSEVSWKSLDSNHTEITWHINFERQLDPAWYFNPWEKAVVKEAAAYLIQATAIPSGSNN